MNYAINHIETYGHGKSEFNTLADSKILTIADHDGNFDVYKCESDKEAELIANWYLSSVYESYPGNAELTKNSSRYYSIEIIENE